MAIDGTFEGFYFELYDFMGASAAITAPFIFAILSFYIYYWCTFKQYSSRNLPRRRGQLVMK